MLQRRVLIYASDWIQLLLGFTFTQYSAKDGLRGIFGDIGKAAEKLLAGHLIFE